ncbi:MAG: cell wall hydrolase [Eubacteriales bacterium]|jgi:N-acetylmuramoyl-L-alanine amidase|nr:cell wall hydrolase [Bacillota bacterium]MBV1727458.1 cell wall hydrolase [Desulforudis sp.]MDZ4043651.1 cell wall hydrolase [Eubacteriales bacterium]MBU4532932.1 cell wall hydrolase [Bacillota bacterium]MBU4555054.1 cell wall hydrolase [Bacillota bacterium]
MNAMATRIKVILLSTLVCMWLSMGTAFGSQPVYYTVSEGDTLYGLAEQYGVSIGAVTVANSLRSSLIFPGQTLIVPDQLSLRRGNVTPDDLELLARVIHAEARGECIVGQVAVGAVILNRLASPDFPSRLEEIIYQRTQNNVYQFSPVGDGTINLVPDDRAFEAARMALMGQDPTNGALFFYNPVKAQDTWIRTLPVVTEIGNHVFATKI